MTDNPLAKLGDLTKPATVLIEKISDAVGGIFRPYQIVKVAKAEAEADRIRAESQIQVTDIHRRAMHRFLDEEAKRQANMEDITEKALPLLDDTASPQKVESDWITNFFEKCRLVSDGDMQKVWSRILAGEANSPGAFSKRTVNLLGDLDKRDAELFANLCGFGWRIGKVIPLVFDIHGDIYARRGINFSSLSHLESLGLVQFASLTGFGFEKFPKRINVVYYGRTVEITFPKDSANSLDIGKVLLTRAGQELATMCDAQPVEGFFDFVYGRWADKSLVPRLDSQGVTEETPVPPGAKANPPADPS